MSLVHSTIDAGFLALTVGALPWIFTTVTRRGEAHLIRALPIASDYRERIQLLFTHAAPIVLGVRVEGAGNWIGSHWLGVVVLALMAFRNGRVLFYLRPQ